MRAEEAEKITYEAEKNFLTLKQERYSEIEEEINQEFYAVIDQIELAAKRMERSYYYDGINKTKLQLSVIKDKFTNLGYKISETQMYNSISISW